MYLVKLFYNLYTFQYNKIMNIYAQIIGWLGTFLIVLAFLLNENKILNSENKSYQILNILGATGVGINVFIQKAWPAFILQIIWIIIAIITLIKIQNKKI